MSSIEAKAFKVVGRQKGLAFGPKFSDFAVEETLSVNAVDFLTDASISLYALDIPQNSAVFVRVPPEIDLTEVAFLFEKQYQLAEAVYTVPFDQLQALVDQMPAIDESRILFIHSTGRCGSTLMSKFFARLPNVISLSEPDYAFLTDPIETEERSKLLACGTRLCCKAIGPRQGSFFVLKYRSQIINDAALLMKLFPKAKNIFLYRNGLGHFKSAAVAFHMFSAPFLEKQHEFAKAMMQYYDFVIHDYADKLDTSSVADFSVLFWQSCMIICKQLLDDGADILPLRYEDMVRAPEQVFKRVLEHCGLNEEALLQEGLKALDKHSQEDSFLAPNADHGAEQLPTEEHYQRFREVVAFNKIVPTVDFVLPKTFIPN